MQLGSVFHEYNNPFCNGDNDMDDLGHNTADCDDCMEGQGTNRTAVFECSKRNEGARQNAQTSLNAILRLIRNDDNNSSKFNLKDGQMISPGAIDDAWIKEVATNTSSHFLLLFFFFFLVFLSDFSSPLPPLLLLFFSTPSLLFLLLSSLSSQILSFFFFLLLSSSFFFLQFLLRFSPLLFLFFFFSSYSSQVSPLLFLFFFSSSYSSQVFLFPSSSSFSSPPSLILLLFFPDFFFAMGFRPSVGVVISVV